MAAPDRRAIPARKSSLPYILGPLIVGTLLAFLLWYFVLSPEEPAISFEPASGSLATVEAPDPAPDYLAQPDSPALFPPATVNGALPAPEPEPEDECTLTSRRISDFFSDLDQRNYIRSRELAGGAQVYFGLLTDRLLADPPIVTGETDSLMSILSNTAHFYQVLGRDDLLLVKDFLHHEGAKLEEILQLFHHWSLIAPDCPPDDRAIDLPLPATYEYAGYFLNTLGGRSYLFRREARVRLLTTYYATLILDQANEAGLNRHGLDIRPTIAELLGSMDGHRTLRQRDQYLTTLIELQDKYLHQYGD